MTLSSKLGLIFAMLLLCGDLNVLFAADRLTTIQRTFHFDGVNPWVTDILLFDEAFAAGTPVLRKLYDEAQQSNRVSTSGVHSLLNNDSMGVVDISSKFTNGWVHLTVRSRIICDKDGSATLDWFPVLKGRVLAINDYQLGERKARLTLYQQNDVCVLLFPDLGEAGGILNELEEVIEFNSGLTTRRESIESLLFTDAGSVRLLTWTFGTPLNAVPVDFVRTLNQKHAMNVSEALSLASNIKLAKPGYYRVTNRPVGKSANQDTAD